MYFLAYELCGFDDNFEDLNLEIISMGENVLFFKMFKHTDNNKMQFCP